MPVRLYTGTGAIEKNREELKLGSSCLIVTGASAAKKCGALDDVTAALDSLGIESTVFSGISGNPSLSSCMEAGRLAAEKGARFIIGIGGGSAMDAAKAVAVLAANPSLDEAGFYSRVWENEVLPIALVGTTAGTGSEVTNVAVLTDSKHRKHSIHDPRMYARVSFGDPKYTMSLPRAVTLSTGVDVLAHCAESFFSKKANEISGACAVRGVRLLLEPLEAAAKGVELTAEQRNRLYEASILGGLAICVTGTCFPHNVGYYLTENYGVPHGTACAVLLPAMLEHAGNCAPEMTEAFFRETGTDREQVLQLIRACLPELGIRMSGEEITAALPRWADNGSVKNTVGTVTAEDIGTILTGLFG